MTLVSLNARIQYEHRADGFLHDPTRDHGLRCVVGEEIVLLWLYCGYHDGFESSIHTLCSNDCSHSFFICFIFYLIVALRCSRCVSRLL
jgi:hypothetical protein